MQDDVSKWVDSAIAAKENSSWQNQYADPDWRKKLTILPPAEEAKFLLWAHENGAPITDDYDMRGYWKEGKNQSSVNPNDGLLHYTDKWKTPLHQSFSGESVYSLPNIPKPYWNDKDQLVDPSGKVIFDERAKR